MASRNVLLVTSMLGSVVAIGVAVWVLGRDHAPARRAAPSNADAGPLGVPAASYDPVSLSAGRELMADEAAPAAPVVLADSAPAPTSVPTEPERRGDPGPPEPPVIPDPGLNAAAAASAAAHPQVVREVAGLLSDRRQALRNACWPGGTQDAATFSIEASFDPAGKLLSLGIPDNRAAPGIGACLRAQKLDLEVSPPGVPVAVEVPLSLP